MSIIGSPPQERFPVQTYVVENSNGIIRNAIHRELKRGGQIYFVYNRVETIEQMKIKLEEIVPDAVIQIAHGQMPEAQLPASLRAALILPMPTPLLFMMRTGLAWHSSTRCGAG